MAHAKKKRSVLHSHENAKPNGTTSMADIQAGIAPSPIRISKIARTRSSGTNVNITNRSKRARHVSRNAESPGRGKQLIALEISVPSRSSARTKPPLAPFSGIVTPRFQPVLRQTNPRARQKVANTRSMRAIRVPVASYPQRILHCKVSYARPFARRNFNSR